MYTQHTHIYTYIQRDYPSPRVLVHCSAGISRSSAVVISYLMRKLCLPLSESLSRVRDKHPAAAPNSGFIAQLMALEQELGLVKAGNGSTLAACDVIAAAYSPVQNVRGVYSYVCIYVCMYKLYVSAHAYIHADNAMHIYTQITLVGLAKLSMRIQTRIHIYTQTTLVGLVNGHGREILCMKEVRI